MEKTHAISVALGTFDGLHLGHKAVIEAAVSDGEGRVLLFREHPQITLTGKNPGGLITKTKERELLNKWEITPVTLDFKELCTLSPEEFFKKIICEKIGATAVSCGFNYRFGSRASGDVTELERLCRESGMKLKVSSAVEYEGSAISSTRIRAALKNGDTTAATAMLGRYFSYDFEVVHGDALGRTLGSPTINQEFSDGFLLPKFGVYASFTKIGGQTYRSVTNIGIRPTVGTEMCRSETNIIGFDGNLYGRNPEVFLVDFLRGEKQFNSVDALSTQIALDREKANKLLSEKKEPLL